ncbi:MAG: hypothetical protein PHR92_17005 [Lachnospiraceae bacterium]|nr:hypothetical protein [Lachnospiraceae bacterium]
MNSRKGQNNAVCEPAMARFNQKDAEAGNLIVLGEKRKRICNDGKWRAISYG